jgi:hypothetical protein
LPDKWALTAHNGITDLNEKHGFRNTKGGNMRKLTILVLGAFALFGATNLSAQANATATVTIPTVLSVSLTGNSFNFAPTQSEFDAGVMNASGSSTLSTKGNVQHAIEIAADNATFTYSGTQTDPSKPASDLEWSSDGGTNWTGLTTTAAQVGSNLARGAHASAATVDYHVLLSYANDVPGTYSLGFTYTVIAN